MKTEQTVLALAGLGGIGAFFLPFLHIQPSLGVLQLQNADIQVSGLTVVLSLLDHFHVYSYEKGRVLIELLTQLWGSADWKNKATAAGLVFILLGPVLYLLYSLGYLIRGLFGRQFKRGVWFNLLFPAAAWGILYWAGQARSVGLGPIDVELSLKLNFFKLAGIGFWLAFASVWVAGFSLLFEKNAK
jgi:hypothetical protein